MSRPVSFEGPNLHFAETLTTVLGFAPERLLSNKAVRSSRPSVEFIVDHVHEFDHVLDADANPFIETFASSSIIEDGLTVGR
jgi:hypothetical protein